MKKINLLLSILFISVLLMSNGSSTAAAEMSKNDLIAALINREFNFSSGVGGWGTSLYIGLDGYFFGVYHDSDMGVSSEDYDATVYVCNFEGQFSVVEQIDDYTYRLRIDWMSQNESEGETWIEDRVQYIGSAPYGLENAGDILVLRAGEYRPAVALQTQKLVSRMDRGDTLSVEMLVKDGNTVTVSVEQQASWVDGGNGGYYMAFPYLGDGTYKY